MVYKDLDVSNFSDSFKDGMAFCALAHSFSCAIDYSELQPYRALQNIRLAFDQLNERHNIPKLLEPNDIVEQPDEICIIIYLSVCYEILH